MITLPDAAYPLLILYILGATNRAHTMSDRFAILYGNALLALHVPLIMALYTLSVHNLCIS